MRSHDVRSHDVSNTSKRAMFVILYDVVWSMTPSVSLAETFVHSE